MLKIKIKPYCLHFIHFFVCSKKEVMLINTGFKLCSEVVFSSHFHRLVPTSLEIKCNNINLPNLMSINKI